MCCHVSFNRLSRNNKFVSDSLIEALAHPSKQSLKTSDGTLSSWLVALSTFAGAVYRRYNVEYEGILQYVVNQMKDGKSVDLMVLRKVVTSTAGFEPTNSLTDDQLIALCSGEVLRQEVGYFWGVLEGLELKMFIFINFFGQFDDCRAPKSRFAASQTSKRLFLVA
jgi:hypothetical protein